MTDTVDGAKHAIDRRQKRINARNSFSQAAVVVDEFRIEVAGNLAKMGDLTVTSADVKKAFGRNFCLHRR